MMTKPSNRKQHNTEVGYIAERMNPIPFVGRKVVIYEAQQQGIDTGGNRYALVCDAHGQIGGAPSMPKAREMMKNPQDFCTACRLLVEGGPITSHADLKEILNDAVCREEF